MENLEDIIALLTFIFIDWHGVTSMEYEGDYDNGASCSSLRSFVNASFSICLILSRER